MKTYNDLRIDGVVVFEPIIHIDNRGWFLESYNSKMKLIEFEIVQENHSFTNKAFTFRGFHHQRFPNSQDKLVRCLKGKILDIVIDFRRDSNTYLSSISIELSEMNRKQLYVPKGCFHGFLTLSDNVEVTYKVNLPYTKESEVSLNPLDPYLTMIDWKNHSILHMSDKDKIGMTLAEIMKLEEL
jgi:dTDP-4-dehydrorhamnose 3,5-epimerase